MNTILSAKNISKNFLKNGTSFCVLKKIDLDLQFGEVVCLLGPSGSGKTTLLQILSGMEKPDAGEIHSEIKCPGPQFGYMTQADCLLPWRTIRDNIALGMQLTGQCDYTKVDELLIQVDLREFASQYPSQISGGMIQRALLARTLATNPKILLLDEPMSNLDVVARRQMANILKNYVREKRASALVVTHSVEEAAFLADRIILFTRSPAILHKELRGDLTLDTIMHSLMSALGERVMP